MRLLVCAATSFEIESTLAFIEEHPEIKSKTSVLVTGVGLTAATYKLTKEVLKAKPTLVVQAGICGSFDESLALGKTIVVANESIGDLGVVENGSFNSVFNLGFLATDEFPWNNGKLSNNNALLYETGLPVVEGVTVNEITTDPERILFYKQQLKAHIETMEGAALHYVCLFENISFLQLRSVSNYVGERNKNRWALKESIAELNKELQRLLIKTLGS